jgi:hypothetical protein
MEYLASVGCGDKVSQWREDAERIVMNGGEDNE